MLSRLRSPNDAVTSEKSLLVVLVISRSSTIKLYGVTSLFNVFLETNKHQNLMRLRQLAMLGVNKIITTIALYFSKTK